MKPIIYSLMILALILVFSGVGGQPVSEPVISKATFLGKTIPLRDMKIVLPGTHTEEGKIVNNRFTYSTEEMKTSALTADKPVLQKIQGAIRSKGPLLNFEGIGNLNGIITGDPNGEVGINHYVQTVNSSFAIWDKSGTLLYGPFDNKTLWESLPGPWADFFWGDPMFKYDHMADRWIISSVALNYNLLGPYYTMIAISVTNDPMGNYYCYAIQFNQVNDYQKLSIWSNGYYITYNMYESFNWETFLFSLVTALDRDAMLIGASEVTMIEFQIPDPDTERFFPLAADLRGENIPDDSPCYIITIDNHIPTNPWHLSLDVYEFQADWQVPWNSQFSLNAQYDLGAVEPLINYGPGATQKGSSVNVMTIPLFLMYPVTYRMFNDHETMLCCHTIWDGNIYYIKWYELRKDETAWYMYQTGSYAPGDAHYYMPSITINGNGDIAMGYNKSNEDMYPSIRLTGRRAKDSLGMMTFQELELYNGLNYANTYTSFYNQNQWGDYSSMMVDPSDDSTFWFTHQYPTASTSFGNWATRIYSINLSEDTVLPYAFAGNDTLAYNVLFFETQGEAENYSSIVWTTTGDGNFITNYAEDVTYLRGPDDLASGQVTLIMHLTGYYPGTEAADSMILYLLPVKIEDHPGKDIVFSLYPNPVRDLMTLKATVTMDDPLTVQVLDSEKKVIFTGNYKPVDRYLELHFDLSYLSTGVYYCQLKTGNQVMIKKIIKL